MSIIESYQKEINKYKVMSEVCIKLLEFKNERDTEFQREEIRRLKNEIVNNHNYNRVRRIDQRIDKAQEFHNGRKTWDEALNEIGVNQADSEYIVCITRLRNFGPKKYLKECLSKIIYYEDLIKKERKAQREHSKNHDRNPKYKGVRPVVINNISYRKPETLDEIIKKHIIEKNAFIEDREILDIKDQFGLSFNNSKQGYLSDDTIDKLFTLRIVTELLNKHEDVDVLSIINAMDSLFELAITEMDYRRNQEYGIRNSINYEMALNEIKDTNRDYVEEYNILYTKLMNYYNKLSKEEHIELSERIKNSKHIQDNGNLLMPESFRLMVNEKAKEKINNWEEYTKGNTYTVIDEISHYTKYMSAEELANYYRSVASERKDINRKNLQEIFAWLIEDRMRPVDDKMLKEEQIEEKRKRLKATCRDYLHEEPLFMDSTNIMVEANYAKKRIETRETIEQSEKRYYRMSKYQQTMAFMNFNKLRKLNSKEILNENEIQMVKGMF